jgi:hypothetical protein
MKINYAWKPFISYEWLFYMLQFPASPQLCYVIIRLEVMNNETCFFSVKIISYSITFMVINAWEP